MNSRLLIVEVNAKNTVPKIINAYTVYIHTNQASHHWSGGSWSCSAFVLSGTKTKYSMYTFSNR